MLIPALCIPLLSSFVLGTPLRGSKDMWYDIM